MALASLSRYVIRVICLACFCHRFLVVSSLLALALERSCTCRRSGCWLVHIACLVCVSNSHVRAMQVHKLRTHTHSFFGGVGEAACAYLAFLISSPYLPHFYLWGQFPRRERNCDVFTSCFDQQKTFVFLFSSAQSMVVNTVEPCYNQVASNMRIPSL